MSIRKSVNIEFLVVPHRHIHRYRAILACLQNEKNCPLLKRRRSHIYTFLLNPRTFFLPLPQCRPHYLKIILILGRGALSNLSYLCLNAGLPHPNFVLVEHRCHHLGNKRYQFSLSRVLRSDGLVILSLASQCTP